MLPLFDDPPSIAGVPRYEYAARVERLADEQIYFGTSSWKYPGWIGSIYTEDRYRGRGGISKRKFEDNCLSEYAETFTTVGGDFSFYRFYASAYWDKLFDRVPDGFQFGLKVPQEVTTAVWPRLARHGARAGTQNTSFLSPDVFREQFIEPLAPHSGKVGVVMFEFGEFAKKVFPGGAHDFLPLLDPFLASLPEGFRYAIEVRNPSFLIPEYLECLTKHNVAHLYNSWTRMPALNDQLDIAETATADFMVCRALLRPGRSYENAVKAFAPYESIQDPYPDGQEALRRMIEKARKERKALFTYVNNRFEGNAPTSILNAMGSL